MTRPSRTLSTLATALGVAEDKVPGKLAELHARVGSLRALEAHLARLNAPAGRTWLGMTLRAERARRERQETGR